MFLEIKSTSERAIRNKANALKLLERWELAIEWYGKCFEIDGDLLNLSNKGWCYAQLAEEMTDIEIKKQYYANAIEIFDSVIESDENNYNAYINKALIFFDLQIYDKCKNNLEKAIEINPTYSGSWGLFGDLERAVKNYENALLFYNKSLEIEPSNVGILNNKANVLDQLERNDEALACYDESIQLELTDFALTRAGIQLNILSRSAEALDYFDESLKIAPENTLTIGNRAHSLRIVKNYEEALACINELIKIEPDDVWNITEKIKIYWDWEKYDEAIEIAEHALRQFPNDEEQILNLLITICKKFGNTSKQKEYEEKLQNLRDSQ